ncbi:histone deacetylase complex protein [Mycena floridula]|nr:histone deacetylase complex protein [Mycena floridula]
MAAQQQPNGPVNMDVDMEPKPGPSMVQTALQNSFPRRAQSEPLWPSTLTVGYVYDPNMLIHFHPRGHQEQPARITRIRDALMQEKLLDRMRCMPIRQVERHEVLLAHSEDHWTKVLNLRHLTEQQRADSENYYEQLSLYVVPGTTYAARLACGGVIECCLAVARDELKKTFAIVRPPGHHAEPDEHMGFCIFNNVAVAARVVQEKTKIKKILILDWDVHHGNGTQRAFNDDPSVLYISLHRYERGEFYPCGPFGGMQSCGEGAGLGYSVNIPWPEAGMGDADYLHAFQKIVMPIAMEFAPELVIISAGFDAAKGDELGECLVSPAGYAHMTHMLSGLANGRLVVALEGGYNLDSICVSASAVVRVLLGEPPGELPPMVAGEYATETVWLVAKEQSKYWKNIDVRSCEPRDEVQPISHSIPEILKSHRQHFLFTNYDMMQVPLLTQDLEDRFSSQIMCTPDFFQSKTLVVLVHEFGNLRAELANSATCNLDLERSYLVYSFFILVVFFDHPCLQIDFSKELIAWVTQEKYSLLDVNLCPKPAGTKAMKSTDKTGRDILTYLWDNYIQMARPHRIILIGHGPGCQPMIRLLKQRSAGVTRDVSLIVQVVGHGEPPRAPVDENLRDWYAKHSAVFLPATHHVFGEKGRPELKKHGHMCPIDEAKPMKLIMRSLSAITTMVSERLQNGR